MTNVRFASFWAAMASLWLSALTSGRAAPGDVDGASDYVDFPRLPDFVISDYDEDDPAAFDFPVSRPRPDDADHMESVHVHGHRIAIRYELVEGGHPLGLMDVQQFYEKAAAAQGYVAQKTGAVGDVNETFRRHQGARDVWAYVEPGPGSLVLTVVEVKAAVAATRPPPAAPSPEAMDAASSSDDPLYAGLVNEGHAVLALRFLPGRPDLDAESQPEIDRVAQMLQLHPGVHVRIGGHTDRTDDSDADLRLSSARARVVASLLVGDGIERNRLEPMGYGGTIPVASNATADGREQNRRIVLYLLKSGDKPKP